MLSLANVGSGEAAASYYEAADDYYMRGECPSSWWGRGAESLGLSGAVERSTFAALLDGRLPTGERLHHAAKGRRGGTDATFSAPKSVSLQALVGGDRRLVEAHRVAVERSLAFAERFAACRVTERGSTHRERTGNLVVARFEHDLSRACDPQFHTHCVMLNATRRSDGQWRAMDNEPIYRAKMLLGALYRAELAHEVQCLGYGVRVTHLDGRFELAHIGERQVEAFSQRSAAIEAYLANHDSKSREEAAAWEKRHAAINTREKKTDVDRAHLRGEWEALSRDLAIDYARPEPAKRLERPERAREAVAQAVAHLSEREASFTETMLLRAALERAVGVATLDDVSAAVRHHIEEGLLLQSGERFTTHAAQVIEREILALEAQGRGSHTSIIAGRSTGLEECLRGLSNAQREAALAIVTTPDAVIGIQGRAGVGKTTLLRCAAEIVRANGYTVQGLAPSASAARELAAAGIEAETISAFARRTSKTLDEKTLLVVDEAGMASSKQMHAILASAQEACARVVLIGDTAQLKAVQAGKPFAQLQAHGMATVMVGEIQRQRNVKLKQAVELAVDRQVARAVRLLDKEIVVIPKTRDRFARIADDYVALSEDERAGTRVIAGTRLARSEINRLIRERLGLVGPGPCCRLLERKDLTDSQARSTLAYEAGDVLMAETDYPSLGMKRGETATVIARSRHRLLLDRDDGTRVAWQPATATRMGTYVAVERELVVGDLVRATANDHKLGLVNGDLLRVRAVNVDHRNLTVEREDGRLLTLDALRPLALDLGYCTTVYASQGRTCDRVLIEADSHSMTANESTFYVAISRARDSVQLYTDDRDMLPIAFSRIDEKSAALDLETARHLEAEPL